MNDTGSIEAGVKLEQGTRMSVMSSWLSSVIVELGISPGASFLRRPFETLVQFMSNMGRSWPVDDVCSGKGVVTSSSTPHEVSLWEGEGPRSCTWPLTWFGSIMSSSRLLETPMSNSARIVAAVAVRSSVCSARSSQSSPLWFQWFLFPGIQFIVLRIRIKILSTSFRLCLSNWTCLNSVGLDLSDSHHSTEKLVSNKSYLSIASSPVRRYSSVWDSVESAIQIGPLEFY